MEDRKEYFIKEKCIVIDSHTDITNLCTYLSSVLCITTKEDSPRGQATVSL